MASSPSLADLVAARTQLDQEVQILSTSFERLQDAQGLFGSNLRTLASLAQTKEGSPTLLPLTTSVYVDGKLSSPHTVMVDVGTGYYLEKSIPEAQVYYRGRIAFLTEQLEKLQVTIREKQTALSVISQTIQKSIKT